MPLTYANRVLPNPVDLVDAAYGGPFRNIRYNLAHPQGYDPKTPWQPDFQTETIKGNMNQNQHARYDDVKLTEDIMRRFHAGEEGVQGG